MKKIFMFFAALIFLAACDKLFEIGQPVPVETNGIKISLSVTRHDAFGSTKATVKSEWADEDVIFVFFKGVAAPKYLEMKYDSGSDTWTPTAKNGLTSSDLSDAADKKMTAIYLPYGSTATVAASEGNFIFNDITYSGYFLKAELVTYIYAGGVLSGTLNMTAPALSSGSDKLIHFDISGFTSGHNYKLYQDYVKPLTFTSVSADGVISTNEGTMGAAITGYEDGSMMSFSGILDASAVGNAVDYQFSIDDLTSSILYTRDAGTKTLSTSKYIGIGAINNDAVWNEFEYVDLGLSVKWATFNVGATLPEEYGDYFAWGETNSKSNYSWSTYVYGDGSVFSYKGLTKYCNDSSHGKDGFADTKTILDSEDDAAHVLWLGDWRMPSDAEWQELKNNCNWIWTAVNGVNGFLLTSKITGYEDRSVFLPAAGYRSQSDIYDVGSESTYWSNSLYTDDPSSANLFFSYSSSPMYSSYGSRFVGHSVRPVFSSDIWLNDVSITLNRESKKMAVGRVYTLIAIAKHLDDVLQYHTVTWSSANPSIATVNETGVVTGISAGSTTITASCCGKEANCLVTVMNELDVEYMDMGLSVKWATCNVGAVNPEDYGDYYAWGEIDPYYVDGYDAQANPQTHWKSGKATGYNWSSYRWCNNSYDRLTKYNTKGNYGSVDGKTTLDPEDDVANREWGGEWRMPTFDEWEELKNNCTLTPTTINGVNGQLITSNIPGYDDCAIFLPCAGDRSNSSLYQLGTSGYYWSKTLHEDSPYWAKGRTFSSSGNYLGTIYSTRMSGYSVRPVHP